MKRFQLIIAILLFLSLSIQAQDTFHVLLDPGHGGGVGTYGYNGEYEDDFVLKYALDASDYIDDYWSNNALYDVWVSYLTRNDDSSISLGDRVAMANNDGGSQTDANGFQIPNGGVDFFLSIHGNAPPPPIDNSITGTEIYWYDSGDQRAIDSRNASSMVMSGFASRIFPEYEFAKWRDIKEANFQVIRDTDMPAVLLETDFVTSTHASTMFSSAYSDKAGEGIFIGVRSLEPINGFIAHVETADFDGWTGDWFWDLGLEKDDGTGLLFKNPNSNFSTHDIEVEAFNIRLYKGSFLVVDKNVNVTLKSSDVTTHDGSDIFSGPAGEIFSDANKISINGGKVTLTTGCFLMRDSGELEILDASFDELNRGFIVVQDGKFRIGDNVNFKLSTTGDANGRGLRLYEGATVELGENARITVEAGAKVLAQGTQQDPVRFIRADPSKKWDKIQLRSSAGNHFEWVLFDGGDRNVEIASKNNVFKHITSRNAWRGISGWHNQDGSGNAEAEISYALIEDNTSVGVVSHYLDLDMSYTTIRNNAQAGLYISSNTVYPFHHNVVTDNGQVYTYRDGIEVTGSGTLYLQAGNLGRG